MTQIVRTCYTCGKKNAAKFYPLYMLHKKLGDGEYYFCNLRCLCECEDKILGIEKLQKQMQQDVDSFLARRDNNSFVLNSLESFKAETVLKIRPIEKEVNE